MPCAIFFGDLRVMSEKSRTFAIVMADKHLYIISGPNVFMPIVDYWMLVDNTRTPRVIVAEGGADVSDVIRNVELYQIIKGYVE